MKRGPVIVYILFVPEMRHAFQFKRCSSFHADAAEYLIGCSIFDMRHGKHFLETELLKPVPEAGCSRYCRITLSPEVAAEPVADIIIVPVPVCDLCAVFKSGPADKSTGALFHQRPPADTKIVVLPADHADGIRRFLFGSDGFPAQVAVHLRISIHQEHTFFICFCQFAYDQLVCFKDVFHPVKVG